MRRFFLVILISTAGLCPVSGQVRYGDGPPPGFFFEAAIQSGEFSENFNAASLASGYANALNATGGNLSFTGNKSFSYNLQGGYYFNHKRNLGIGTGILLLTQSGTMQSDSFHVEYMAHDYQGNVYRQLISSNGNINESVKTINLSIPLFLRYKKDITDDLFLTIDGGILYNLLLQNKYSGNQGFDYEAIYKIQGSGTNLTYMYDNAATPGGTDWLVTKQEFLKDNPNGNMQAYFNSLKSIGYNVGLGDTARKSGKVNYSNKSVGFTFQSAINYKIRDRIYGKGGIYVLSQSFTNSSYSNSTALTDKPGTYNSLLNFSKGVQNWSYGFVFGICYSLY